MDNVLAIAQRAIELRAIDPLERFNFHFRVAAANTPELIEAAFKLRYQVYCLERKFEDPNQYADFLERDRLDCHSIHSVIFYRGLDEPIGTVRIIAADPKAQDLPIQQVLLQNGIDPSDYFDSNVTGEISRFALSKEFRRRQSAEQSAENQWSLKRQKNLPCLGLIQSILRHSLEGGISTWAAMMEPQLLRLLSSLGIRFTPVGPIISHHGLRQPSFCKVPQMIQVLKYEQPENWSVVTNGGELS